MDELFSKLEEALGIAECGRSKKDVQEAIGRVPHRHEDGQVGHLIRTACATISSVATASNPQSAASDARADISAIRSALRRLGNPQ